MEKKLVESYFTLREIGKAIGVKDPRTVIRYFLELRLPMYKRRLPAPNYWRPPVWYSHSGLLSARELAMAHMERKGKSKSKQASQRLEKDQG